MRRSVGCTSISGNPRTAPVLRIGPVQPLNRKRLDRLNRSTRIRRHRPKPQLRETLHSIVWTILTKDERSGRRDVRAQEKCIVWRQSEERTGCLYNTAQAHLLQRKSLSRMDELSFDVRPVLELQFLYCGRCRHKFWTRFRIWPSSPCHRSSSELCGVERLIASNDWRFSFMVALASLLVPDGSSRKGLARDSSECGRPDVAVGLGETGRGVSRVQVERFATVRRQVL